MTETTGLTGRYFHSFEPDGWLVCWQGQVIADAGPGLYLVQLFEWFFGAESMQKIVRLADMRDWCFYATADEMTASYDRVLSLREPRPAAARQAARR